MFKASIAVIAVVIISLFASSPVSAQVGAPSMNENWVLPDPTLKPEDINSSPRIGTKKEFSKEDSLKMNAKKLGFGKITNKALKQILDTSRRVEADSARYEMTHRHDSGHDKTAEVAGGYGK